MDDATKKQILDQCRVVAHMARTLADLHDGLGKTLDGAIMLDIGDLIGQRTASITEVLGDILNGMDAVEEGDEEWMDPIFEEAQRRWPVERASH